MSAWQPIKTAPKDGRYLLLWVPAYSPGLLRGSFRKDTGFSGVRKKLWLKDDYDDYSTGFASTPIEPTHWMPIPDPPTDLITPASADVNPTGELK